MGITETMEILSYSKILYLLVHWTKMKKRVVKSEKGEYNPLSILLISFWEPIKPFCYEAVLCHVSGAVWMCKWNITNDILSIFLLFVYFLEFWFMCRFMSCHAHVLSSEWTGYPGWPDYARVEPGNSGCASYLILCNCSCKDAWVLKMNLENQYVGLSKLGPFKFIPIA